jgi:uncharacterized RDD family membrane protein YckC
MEEGGGRFMTSTLASDAEEERGHVFYARIGIRMKAFLIDSFIVGVAFLIAAVAGANLPGRGAVAFSAWAAFALLYDPVMIWRSSGTIGHHLQNIRVVSDRTGGRPSLARALVRNIAKVFFGGFSFLAMAFSSRSKSLHDWLAGTTVQIQNPAFARSKDFVKVPKRAQLRLQDSPRPRFSQGPTMD